MSETHHDHGQHEPEPKPEAGHGPPPDQGDDEIVDPLKVIKRTAMAMGIPVLQEGDGPEASPAAHDAHAGHGHGEHGHGEHGHGEPGHGEHGHGEAKPAAHGAGGGHATLGRNIGMTMAVLGVLLAFSAAMVGGERTEFVAAMVEHTNATGQFQAVATKHRVLQAQLQQLHAGMPRQPAFDKNEAALVKLEADLAKLEQEQKLPGTASAALRTARLETRKVLNAVIPTRADLLRFATLVKKYSKEREAAEHWSESYEDSVELHEHAAEHYEYAELAAEIGIVMASIALLLHNRRAWIASMSLGGISVTVLLITGVGTYLKLNAAEQKIHEAHHHYVEATEAGDEEHDDVKLLKEVTGEPFDESALPARKHEGGEHGEAHGGGEHGGEAHGGGGEHGGEEAGEHGGEKAAAHGEDH